MSLKPKNTNQLAEERTEMAFYRSVMALERSLMAWIRTSLSMISFGFTIYKILQAMHDSGAGNMREHAPRNLGLFLIFLGMGLLTLAVFQFKNATKRLERFSEFKTQLSLPLVGAIGILLAGLFTILNITLGLGGF